MVSHVASWCLIVPHSFSCCLKVSLGVSQVSEVVSHSVT